MTNQLTQAELEQAAIEVGLITVVDHDDRGPVYTSDFSLSLLAKFAQLIQQREADNRQDEPAAYQFKGRDGEWKNFMNQAHYANTRDSGEWEIRALYTQPQTVKQALEKAAAIAMNAPITANMMDSDAAKAVSFHASAHIRALIDQPVEQGEISLPHMENDTRAALLYALWHHQGGSSKIGQSIRRILGIEQHAHLTKDQYAEAHRVQEALGFQVEQGGDELVEACQELISQYEAVPEFTLGGNLTNGPFLKIRQAIAKRRGGE